MTSPLFQPPSPLIAPHPTPPPGCIQDWGWAAADTPSKRSGMIQILILAIHMWGWRFKDDYVKGRGERCTCYLLRRECNSVWLILSAYCDGDIEKFKVKHTRFSEVHGDDGALLNTPPPRAETPWTRGSQREKDTADFWYVRTSKKNLTWLKFYSSPLRCFQIYFLRNYWPWLSKEGYLICWLSVDDKADLSHLRMVPKSDSFFLG